MSFVKRSNRNLGIVSLGRIDIIEVIKVFLSFLELLNVDIKFKDLIFKLILNSLSDLLKLKFDRLIKINLLKYKFKVEREDIILL